MEPSVRCPKCWKHAPGYARFCPRCGSSLRIAAPPPPPVRLPGPSVLGRGLIATLLMFLIPLLGFVFVLGPLFGRFNRPVRIEDPIESPVRWRLDSPSFHSSEYDRAVQPWEQSRYRYRSSRQNPDLFP